MSDEPAVHLDPIWRHKANFLIRAELADDESSRKWEQLWARQLSADTFELCCIPFFAYDLALGDEVITGPKGESRYVIQHVVRPSRRFCCRVWFGDSPDVSVTDEIVGMVKQLDLLAEFYSANLLAIDAPSKAVAHQLSGVLLQQEKLGRLKYETGRMT